MNIGKLILMFIRKSKGSEEPTNTAEEEQCLRTDTIQRQNLYRSIKDNVVLVKDRQIDECNWEPRSIPL